MNRATQFSAAYAALTAAHEVADHIVQVDRDAVAKGRHGAEGGSRASGMSGRTR